MLTLFRHGVSPLAIHAAIAEMEAEAKKELGAAIVCRGSRNTHDPLFNEKQDHEPNHIVVETYWEVAPPPAKTERVRPDASSKKGSK